MKRKRFSVEQIVAIVKQAELGLPVTELIRRVGISEKTFYRWKKQYSNLEVDQVRQLKQLQDENGRLKKLAASEASAGSLTRPEKGDHERRSESASPTEGRSPVGKNCTQSDPQS
jgi:putative transposase